jgi:phosphoserine phosphatase
MLTPSWQLTDPIDAIIFDCDGTLSKIEGIDELALSNNVSDIVQKLTQDAMGKSGMNAQLYSKRLELANPTQDRITEIGKAYIQNPTPDILEIIAAFKSLNKPVYIVSAGIFQAVSIFAKWLGIDENNVYAVNVSFDNEGHYLAFDQHSPLISRNGKQVYVKELSQNHSRLGFIGDGLNDYEVYPLVKRFIGYGGAYYRRNIAELCEFYVNTASLAPILPLLITLDEYHKLSDDHQLLYEKGMTSIINKQTQIQDMNV